MERIRAGFANSVDDATGGPSILGRVITGEHREFLNRIHPQADSDHAARPAVAVIVDAVAVQPVIVLRGPSPGNSQLRPKAPVAPPRPLGFEGQLCFYSRDAG